MTGLSDLLVNQKKAKAFFERKNAEVLEQKKMFSDKMKQAYEENKQSGEVFGKKVST